MVTVVKRLVREDDGREGFVRSLVVNEPRKRRLKAHVRKHSSWVQVSGCVPMILVVALEKHFFSVAALICKSDSSRTNNILRS